MLESISSIPFVDWAANGESIMAPNAPPSLAPPYTGRRRNRTGLYLESGGVGGVGIAGMSERMKQFGG